MSRGFQLRQWISQGAEQLAQKLTAEIFIWIKSTPSNTSSRYRDYIEGILAEFAYKRGIWQREGVSEAKILLLLIPEVMDVLRGIFQLTMDRYSEVIRLFLCANNELLKLLEVTNFPADLPLLWFRRLLQWCHYSIGNESTPISKVKIRLNSAAQVINWDTKAEQIFGWSQQDALGKDAISLFIPPIETDSEPLASSSSLEIGLFQDDLSFNIYQNQNVEGKTFWMFWVNVPLVDHSGDVTEFICVAMKTDEPDLIRQLIQILQGKRFHHFFWQKLIRWRKQWGHWISKGWS